MAFAIRPFTEGMVRVPFTAEQIEVQNRLRAAGKIAWAAFLDAQKAGLSDAECVEIHNRLANAA